MADTFQAKTDTRSALAGLDILKGPLATHLARSMAVAGGTIYRDEAKVLAPKKSGLLASSIYLAFKAGRSSEESVTYSISWNAKKAPHGHLEEFGYWQVYATFKGADGEWRTNKNVRLAAPRWVPAHPFLRPAFYSAREAAQQAMLDRGKERLPELLRQAYQPSDDEFV